MRMKFPGSTLEPLDGADATGLLETLKTVGDDLPELRSLAPAESCAAFLVDRLTIARDYAEGSFLLAMAGNGSALVTLTRTALESLIGTYWASTQAARCERLQAAAVRELQRIVRHQVKSRYAKIVERETGADKSEEVVGLGVFDEALKLPRFNDMATEAGVRSLYGQLYGVLSVYSHAAATELLQERDQRDLCLSKIHAASAMLRAEHAICERRVRQGDTLSVHDLSAILKVPILSAGTAAG